MWAVHARPDNPKTMVAGSRYGYLYRRDDGGDTWRKFWFQNPPPMHLLKKIEIDIDMGVQGH